MKIAVCMSGLARTFAKCYSSYCDNLLSRYDCDVFVYISKDNYSSDIDIMPCVKKVVLEKDYILDEKDYIRYKRKSKKYTIQGILQQLWKIKMCNDLMLKYQKENNIKYDWVIRCRPDLKLLSSIDNLEYLDNRYMYMPLSQSYVDVYTRLYNGQNFYSNDFIFDYKDCVPDQIALGSVQLMNTYSSRYNDLEYIVKRKNRIHPEGSLIEHLRYNNVQIKFLKMLFEIKR